MNVVQYNEVSDSVHVFSFMNNGEHAVDSYVSLWHSKFGGFWRSNPHDGTVRINVLLDFRRSGVPCAMQLYHGLQHYQREFPDHPPMRMAVVLHPQRDFITRMQTCVSLIDKANRIQLHFFRIDEYDKALAWLSGI